MNKFKSAIKEAFTFAIPLFFVMTFIRGCDAVACVDLRSQTDVETNFSWFSGCYVKVGGRWIPEDSWRGEYEAVGSR